MWFIFALMGCDFLLHVSGDGTCSVPGLWAGQHRQGHQVCVCADWSVCHIHHSGQHVAASLVLQCIAFALLVSRVSALTSLPGVTLQVGFLSDLFQVIKDRSISIDCVTTSGVLSCFSTSCGGCVLFIRR